MDAPAPQKGGSLCIRPRQRGGREHQRPKSWEGLRCPAAVSRAKDKLLLQPAREAKEGLPQSPDGRRFLKLCDGTLLALPGLRFHGSFQPTNQTPGSSSGPSSRASRAGRRGRGLPESAGDRRSRCPKSVWLLYHSTAEETQESQVPLDTTSLGASSGPGVGVGHWMGSQDAGASFLPGPDCCQAISTSSTNNRPAAAPRC